MFILYLLYYYRIISLSNFYLSVVYTVWVNKGFSKKYILNKIIKPICKEYSINYIPSKIKYIPVIFLYRFRIVFIEFVRSMEIDFIFVSLIMLFLGVLKIYFLLIGILGVMLLWRQIIFYFLGFLIYYVIPCFNMFIDCYEVLKLLLKFFGLPLHPLLDAYLNAYFYIIREFILKIIEKCVI